MKELVFTDLYNGWYEIHTVHVDIVQAETVMIKLEVISRDAFQEDGEHGPAGQYTTTCTNWCLFVFLSCVQQCLFVNKKLLVIVYWVSYSTRFLELLVTSPQH